jgi:RNA polymerase sigma-70 factor (ECF subfamily)
MSRTPASLLERLRQPDPGPAWDRLVALYAPLVHLWATRAGLQDADAADLVQDVFTTLVQQLPTFRYDPSKSFRAWLKTVTLNLWRARRRRAAPRPLDGVPEPAVADPADAFWDGEYRRHLAAWALHAMQTEFEDRTWRACWLTAVEGRPPAEVAAGLGMTVGAVYTARCRVLARLREELKGMLE